MFSLFGGLLYKHVNVLESHNTTDEYICLFVLLCTNQITFEINGLFVGMIISQILGRTIIVFIMKLFCF